MNQASEAPALPEYSEADFHFSDPPEGPHECDLVLKGGVTSGVVYPYALLAIATRYRFRSIGGTSVGAIAAAFAAAAEYGRREGDPGSFVRLQEYALELPGVLESLFQPSPELAPAFERIKAARKSGVAPILGEAGRIAKRWGIAGGVGLAGLSALVFAVASDFGVAAIWALGLALILGAAAGVAFGLGRWAWRGYVDPALGLIAGFQANDFGFCTGLTQSDEGPQALTDWMHEGIQRIAFGEKGREAPLTFGDLRGDGSKPRIDLAMVTTNLSMRRPHTLPDLKLVAGFDPAAWSRLFPRAIMAHLEAKSRAWHARPGLRRFPSGDDLPVVVAARMSLSFPLLFTTVPLIVRDIAQERVLKQLGATRPPGPIYAKAYFSDGGLSSNFPVHMFDTLLPARPTFAFNLTALLGDPAEVRSRVALPQTTRDGLGAQVSPIAGLLGFGWSMVASAKDWQDQLLSEITGQRERIVHVYLAKDEGGLNLEMDPDVSRRLMLLGHEAGHKFIDEGQFDFDEHKWRRMLALYGHLRHRLPQTGTAWDHGFRDWFAGYDPKSYKMPRTAQRRIGRHLAQVLKTARLFAEPPPAPRLPKKAGTLKVGPKF